MLLRVGLSLSVHFRDSLHELTCAVCSLGRINQASATWPCWLRPSCAQLIRVPCGPDMRKTNKREEWEEYRDRKNRRQWMIMMTRAILLASVEDNPPPLPSCTRPHPPPWPWPWLWFPHGRAIWLRSVWVKCHHQAGSALSAVGYDWRKEEGRMEVHVIGTRIVKTLKPNKSWKSKW